MRKVKGFTLIELLVVISIIVLLMAILLPVVQRVRNQARAVACQAHLKQWGTILALYTEDNQGRLPGTVVELLWLLRSPSLIEGDPNKPDVYQDVNAKGIALCPMAVRSRGGATINAYPYGASGNRLDYRSGSTFEAWEIAIPLPPFRGSYGFNGRMTRGGLIPWIPEQFTPRHYIEIFSLKGRANIPTLLDSTRPIVNVGASATHRPPSYEFKERGFCINRHNGHINVLFMDWSVRKVGLKELWTLKWDSKWDTAGPWTKAGGVQTEDWPQWMRSFKDY